MSTDYLALSHVRHQLILDEHYRVYGPKENRYINALLVLNAILGIGGIINVYFDIDEFRYLIFGQGAIMVVVFILTVILNRKHDKYMEDFKVFVPDPPSETE